jgi:ornithine decarboxylase
VVALGDTDFTDVAAVVITAADSRSGILALLKRTGIHLPVFLYSEHAVELPAGVTAVINGNEQQWLELESAACQYEENLLPPFYDTLTQYVEMGNSTFACPGHQHGASACHKTVAANSLHTDRLRIPAPATAARCR